MKLGLGPSMTFPEHGQKQLFLGEFVPEAGSGGSHSVQM